ncbi:2Fe-2S iron-sulfur cluster-binding protein, partial [Streptomyces sp. NPDC014727]|uniref:2Fe-2S iron-sulfur cluster-binding protein n=1 Tax=Streptomyces sp. NPDC014727 TaxID=3364883 RepID=UPI00370060C2
MPLTSSHGSQCPFWPLTRANRTLNPSGLIHRGQAIDAAFRQGIHLMHGCREGRCSACKSYVLDGEIQMENYSTFACNEAEVDEGYVLLCRSTAYSDCTVELLNFDEDELLGGIPIQ